MDGQVIFLMCLITIPALIFVTFIALSITRPSTLRIRDEYDKLLNDYRVIERRLKDKYKRPMIIREVILIHEYRKDADELFIKYCKCNRGSKIDYGWNKGIKYVKEAIETLNNGLNEFDMKTRRENKISNLFNE